MKKAFFLDIFALLECQRSIKERSSFKKHKESSRTKVRPQHACNVSIRMDIYAKNFRIQLTLASLKREAASRSQRRCEPRGCCCFGSSGPQRSILRCSWMKGASGFYDMNLGSTEASKALILTSFCSFDTDTFYSSA